MPRNLKACDLSYVKEFIERRVQPHYGPVLPPDFPIASEAILARAERMVHEEGHIPFERAGELFEGILPPEEAQLFPQWLREDQEPLPGLHAEI